MSQGALLGRDEEMIRVLNDNTTKNSQNISDLAHQISPLLSVQVSTLAAATIPCDGSGAASAAVREFHACNPEPFDRNLGKCRGFLLQCCLVFEQRPQSFSLDSAKVNYVVGLLRGKVWTWTQALSTHSPT